MEKLAETIHQMLIETETLPPESHPNYRLWANYAKFARNRGTLTADILEHETSVRNADVLDVGCGEGGTALELALRGANVTAIDFNPAKIQRLKQKTLHIRNLTVLEKNAKELSSLNIKFDQVVLQDVLEHLSEPEAVLQTIADMLKPGGKLFLSTPNRWSPLNFVNDPHWNLPVVAILPRKAVAFFILKIVKREQVQRNDFAALLSLKKLKTNLSNVNLTPRFVHTHIANALFTKPTSVVNSELHLRIVAIMKKLHLAKFVESLVNDRFGLFNYSINPTWYLIAEKDASL